MKERKFEKGQSLFEVVLSLAVITLIIITLILLATHSIRNANFSRNKTLGARLAQEALEWMRGERDEDFDAFATRALTNQYCLPDLSWAAASIGSCGSTDYISGTNLKREVFFDTVTADNIEVQIVIYWEDAQGIHEVRTITNLTDWRSQ
jgi:Tfp pilus assembly protein PilV